GAISFAMPCISGWSTTGSRWGGACGCTSALAGGGRPAMGRGATRARRGWPGHFEGGPAPARAGRDRGQGAAQAPGRYAYAEAIGHLTRGLELLQRLPETPARVQQELTLQMALGPALIATKGQAAPEVEQTYARARELCRQSGETPQLFPILR